MEIIAPGTRSIHTVARRERKRMFQLSIYFKFENTFHRNFSIQSNPPDIIQKTFSFYLYHHKFFITSQNTL